MSDDRRTKVLEDLVIGLNLLAEGVAQAIGYSGVKDPEELWAAVEAVVTERDAATDRAEKAEALVGELAGALGAMFSEFEGEECPCGQGACWERASAIDGARSVLAKVGK